MHNNNVATCNFIVCQNVLKSYFQLQFPIDHQSSFKNEKNLYFTSFCEKEFLWKKKKEIALKQNKVDLALSLWKLVLKCFFL